MNRLVQISCFVALVACGRPSPANPAAEESQGLSSASCGADCTSSITCRDVFSACRYCGISGCSATLPATPTPDAGIDAAPGSTKP
jgi:hypothetical protein